MASPYECRSLLFKALHNLIQRCLLSRGFTRMGKWFLQPCDSADKDRGGSSGTQLSFSFHFFVHGDSTVCASVDVRQHPPIHRISRQHLLAAQSASQSPCKVILGPYGLAGVLTGQGFKENDVSTQTLLAEWHQFYPLPLLNNSAHRSDATASSGDEEPLPCALEVLVGGVKLRYPSCYVFIAESDEPVSGQQTEPSQGTTPVTPAPAAASGPFGAGGGMHGAAPVRPHNFPAGIKPGIPPGLTAVLTPPTSPCEPGYLHGAMMAARTASGAAGTSQSFATGHAMKRLVLAGSSVTRVGRRIASVSGVIVTLDLVRLLPRRALEVWSAGAHLRARQELPLSRNPVPTRALHIPPLAARQSLLREVALVSNSAPSTPFHRRSPVPGVDYEGAVALVSRVASGGLPQLSHQPAVGGPPPSVGSCSHPGTPLLLSEGPASQASQADPAMPTLSPHPPPRDEPRPSPAPGASPAPAVAESAKDRQPGEQLLSPSSLLEVKPPLEAPPSCSPGGTSHPWGGPGSVPSSSAATPLASTVVHAPPSVGTDEMPGTPLAAPGGPASLPPGLKRPCLPAVPHEALLEAEASMPLGSCLLYDYTTIYQPPWDVPPSKRPAMGAPRRSSPNDAWRLSLPCRQPELNGDCMDCCFGQSDGGRRFHFRCIKCEGPPAPAQQNGTPNQTTTPVVVKEEEKDSVPMEIVGTEPALSSVDPSGVAGIAHGGGIGEPTTPGSQGDIAPGGSPPTPRHPGFTRVEDLKVTECDLENIFDTSSSDESSDDPFQAPSTPSSTKPPGATDEAITKSKKQHDSRHSWSGRIDTDSLVIGRWTPTATVLVRALTALRTGHTYTRLPSHHPGIEERASYHGSAAMMGSPGAAMGYEMGQAPYQAALMGGFPAGRGPCLGGPPEPATPEADSLLVNLLLSDSLLELFRDHNFASCTLCVCNMNIKGADVGVYLPPSLVPTASEEAQYKCTCGFSAVVNRHQSHRAGLFYQDELDITGLPYEARPGPNAKVLLQQQQLQQQARLGPAARAGLGMSAAGHLPTQSLAKVNEEGLMDYVQNQCLGMSLSPCSVLHKTLQLGSEPPLPPPVGARPSPSSLALLQALDGCEVASGALEAVAARPLEDNLRSSCLHHWPYLHCPFPTSSLLTMGLLRGLQPLLQDAVHKKRNQGLWEVTYRVAGPLTWRQFHRLAGRGTEDQCEPQPIPSLLVGYDRDWVALSPFALKYWDKLLLEPYSPSRDIAYVVVMPDSEAVLPGVRAFFQDLSATYQALNLGRHCPLSRGGLREGLLRVSCSMALPSTSEPQQPPSAPDDDWLGPLAEGPLGPRLRLFARACKLQLGPHLATQSLDRGMLEGPPSLEPVWC
ncbi:hypothetical protein MRX96_003676 [Rhipicephalus microplus]